MLMIIFGAGASYDSLADYMPPHSQTIDHTVHPEVKPAGNWSERRPVLPKEVCRAVLEDQVIEVPVQPFENLLIQRISNHRVCSAPFGVTT